MSCDFNQRDLPPGKYEISVTMTLALTVNSYAKSVDEAEMCVKAITLGAVTGFEITPR